MVLVYLVKCPVSCQARRHSILHMSREGLQNLLEDRELREPVHRLDDVTHGHNNRRCEFWRVDSIDLFAKAVVSHDVCGQTTEHVLDLDHIALALEFRV